MIREWTDPSTDSYAYYRTLPAQARVHDGIALSSLTIALANDWFREHPNVNLNLASAQELEKLWGSSFDPILVAAWVLESTEFPPISYP
jgi:hypothetical protein